MRINKLLIIGVLAFIGFLSFISILIDRNHEKREEVYTLITYDRFLTLLNDGGTHFDTRYEIDMKKKIVVKLEDYYKGFEGLQYENKVLYQKTLNETKNLQALFDDIVKKKEQYETDFEHTYMYYELKMGTEEIKIYDKAMIQKLEAILKEG